MIPSRFKLKSTVKYPTSLIIAGVNPLGIEIAESLTEQGGYVVLVDSATEENIKLLENLPENKMISFADYSLIPHLIDDLRRLDYVFFFNHESIDYKDNVSTGEFLTFSNYLDAALSLATEFDAKFLLTTSQKANQILFTESSYHSVDLRSGNRPTIYTEMEVQRYSEGLVNEYHEKTGLNTRIARVGELIGNNIDIQKSTIFNRLLRQAIAGQNLELESDGLDIEWLIHTSDAAYGLIKAMFAKKTDGNVYSVCYDNAFTHLAIAYKIQELEKEAKEIRFVEKESSVPVLNTYKSAQNLTMLGWMPRISFSRAVKQSLAAAKLQALNETHPNRAVNQQKDKKTVDKLRKFIGINSKEGSKISVEQRKEIKQKGLDDANKEIQRGRKKKRTLSQKIHDWFWKIYSPLAKRFEFLRERSPATLGLMFTVLIFFVLIFIFILSPVLVIIKDVALILPRYDELVQTSEEQIIPASTEQNEKIDGSLENLSDANSRFGPLLSFFGQGESVDAFADLLDEYRFLNNGYKDMIFALSPFRQYVDSYQNNLQLRNSTDSFVSIGSSTVDYSDFFSVMVERSPFLLRGQTTFENSLETLANSSTSAFWSFIENRIIEANNQIIADSENASGIQDIALLPELLGAETPKTHLVVLLDNSRQTPLGGDIAGFALLTFSRGSITEVTVKRIDNSDFDFSELTESDIEAINLRSFSTEGEGTIEVTDLSNIKDYEEFAGIARVVWGKSFSRDIDGVIAVDLSSLQELNSSLDTSFSIFDQGINSDSELLSVLNTLLSTNSNLTDRNSFVTQIFANILVDIENNLISKFDELYRFFGDGITSQDIQLAFEDIDVSERLEEQEINSTDFKESEIFIDIGFKNNSDRLVEPDRYSSIDVTSSAVVNANLGIENTLLLRFPNSGVSNEISVCLPLNTDINSIDIENIPLVRTKINTLGSERCVVMNIVSESTVQMSWNSNPNLDISEGGSFNVDIPKVNGTVNSTLDYSIRFDESIGVSIDDDTLTPVDNTVVFTSTLNRDLGIEVDLSK